jgi:RNA polymerase sigma-70 factor, ECF subfamily
MSDERLLLDAAQAGDEEAFGLLVAPYQAQLRAHCYRMLGSLADADDALQETLLRAWSGLGRFEGRSSLRSWLYRIATNASLRIIEKRPKRVLPIDYGPAADPHAAFGEPLTESIWLEPYPDTDLAVGAALLGPDARYEQRESIELAFTAAVQHLPARQRAVLILRDVLGFSARETAEALGTTPVSVDSALQRAHKAIEERGPAQTQQATLRELGDSELRELVKRFTDAWERNDVDSVVAMLADDARMTMPPWSSWYSGRDAVATFLRGRPLSARKRWQVIPIGANGQPAVAGYLWDEQTGAFEPEFIIVLTLRAGSIEEIAAFRSPGLFPRFGLPEHPPA